MSQKFNNTQHAILDAALKLAPFDGWTEKTLRQATKNINLPKGADELYFPNGILELVAFWSASMDERAEAKIKSLDLPTMKIRDKVTAGVIARLEAIGNHDEAARRVCARLMLPNGLVQGTTQIWASADMIWRAIGDTSTDGNFYSKRATLSAVLTATLPVWLSDESEGKLKGREFLDARIADVMKFETFKWDVKTRSKDWPNPAEILGDLRYGKFPFKRQRRRQSRSL
ncbi:MAG: COQ9 family protein [Litorimonas sp.]